MFISTLGMALTPKQVFIAVFVALAAIIIISTIVSRENGSHSNTEQKSDTAINKAFTAETVEIKTRNGVIQGVKEWTARYSREFYSFRGIPYAEPPILELRFKDPVAVRPWYGKRGGKMPPPCPQYSIQAFMKGNIQIIGQEDCLYLNVYTPMPSTSDLPVMVFIHGGGFIFGNPDNLGGAPKFLLTKDIVLVSIQYRLGTLGFLSTEDSVLPGNLGLKDQNLALRWIQENIRDFGGNPKKVTLFGHSAGAASVHLHLMSPYSAGLFQQAILQSGQALAPFAVRSDHKVTVEQIRDILNCPEADSIAFLSCLQSVPFENITYSALKLQKFSRYPFYMLPRVDGDFLPDHPAVLLKQGRYQKVSLMSGHTVNEGAATAISILKNNELKTALANNFEVVGPVICGIEAEKSAAQLANRIFYHYMDDIEALDDNDAGLVEYVSGVRKHKQNKITPLQTISESFYNRGHDDVLLIHARDSLTYGNKIFMYEFEHRGKRAFIDAFHPDHGSPCKCFFLQYMFA
ncbi:Carboxylesterase 5A [Halocaridina rubra]|uniref:Carboxylic ester hydrolase n=1 Tax=Halocaridina rubra TaxID=373956 RepID=A0AAN9AH08_HALRR